MTRTEQLQAALDLALCRLIRFEPGDSRAVSGEFVAMAAVACDCVNDAALRIIKDALAKESPKGDAV